MPSTTNCTAIAHSTSPISRVRIRTPVWPSRRSTRAAAARVRYDRQAVSAIAPRTPRVMALPLEAPVSTMTVEMAPGPASIGTPSGMMPTSSYWLPSAWSAGVSFCWRRRAWTMSSAFRPIRIPPAILNAPIVMPNSRKIRPPPSANAVSVIAHVQAPRRAIARRTSGVSRAVIARKLGTAVSGSTMNSTEVKIRNSSCRVFTMGRWSDRHLHDPVLARPFGLVHRRVGLAEHVVGVRVATGPGHDPDARRHGRGAAEHGSDAARQPGGRGVGDGAVGLGHQDRELVAPEPADDVRLAHGGAHRVRDEAQHRVARRVTVSVVHPLEVVQVEVDQRQRAAVPAVAAQLLAQLLGEGARVEDGGERVLGRELVQLPLRPPQLRQPGDGDPDHREVRALVREPRHERCAGRHLVDPPDEAQ